MTLLIALLLACEPPPEADSSAVSIDAYNPLQYVDPFIGTGGPAAAVGSINPGAVLPWGMVQAGPISRGTVNAPWYHCAGYYYPDMFIVGFGHIFAHGMGVTEMGGLVVMPKAEWDPSYTTPKNRRSTFSHDREDAAPGYYTVDLQDDGIVAEMSATRHGASHRYTFASGVAEPTLIVDLASVLGLNDHVSEAWIDVNAETGRIQGFERLNGGYSERFGGLMQHFDAYVDPPPVKVGTWVDPDAPESDSTSASAVGQGVGAWLIFPEGTTEVTLRIGVSFVDIEGAVANLAAEVPTFDLEGTRAAAEAEWLAEMGNVRVRSTRDDTAALRDMRIFHTAQYHTYQMPRTYSDVDGRYRGFDQEIHDDPGHVFYSDFSGWDTFRTQHPWLTLVLPDRQRAMNQSLLRMTADGGSLPRWPLAHGYTGGMVGTPMAQVLAGSYLKGVDGWDVDAGWDAAVAAAMHPQADAGRTGIDAYMSKGYVPVETSDSGAALTLEYAWSDGALAEWGDALGKPEAAQLRTMSSNWKNVWDAESGFFFAKNDAGEFPNATDPTAWSGDFVEGAAWQYVWMVPQDPMGMVDVQHGGDVDAFIERYDEFWFNTFIEQENTDRTAGLPGAFYWHGNEPDIHYAFMGSLVGRPDATAVPSRWITENKYDDAGWGIDGNDDGGTLSAWYLFGSTGFFPVAGTDRYAIGSPIFERTEIDLADGGSLVIRAPGTTADAMFIQSATLGGEEFSSGVVTHRDLIGGGELVLEMGTKAVGWGAE